MEDKPKARTPIGSHVVLKVEYMPLPEERVPAWRAGVKLLLSILKSEQDTEQVTERSEVTKPDE